MWPKFVSLSSLLPLLASLSSLWHTSDQYRYTVTLYCSGGVVECEVQIVIVYTNIRYECTQIVTLDIAAMAHAFMERKLNKHCQPSEI